MRSHTSELAVLAVTCVIIAASSPARAQAPMTSCGPNDVVPWWPRSTLYAGANTLTAAERTAVEARLAAVEALVRKSPYASPRGFAVVPAFSIHEITSRTELYSYGFLIDTKNRCSKYDEAQAHLIVDFNPDPMSWSGGDRPSFDERGEAFYMERPRREAILGSTATFGGFHEENTNTSAFFLLFTTGGESPTLPVSREEYLRSVIFQLEGKDGEKAKEMQALASKTPLDRWLEEAPERKKRNEELFATITQVAPAQAAKLRADMEKAEQAELEKLRRVDAYERAQLAKNVAGVTLAGDKMRARLAAMTPQERTLPAFVQGFFDVVPATTPNAYAIVRKNQAFYRVRSSPLEPRAILVRMPNGYKELWPQQEALYKQFDWAAIKKMVNP